MKNRYLWRNLRGTKTRVSGPYATLDEALSQKHEIMAPYGPSPGRTFYVGDESGIGRSTQEIGDGDAGEGY
jgi:hypothetical protein